MDHRDLNRIGRCCARCWTPYMCGRAICGCHGDSDAQCGSCGTRLFVPRPPRKSFRQVFERAAA